MNSKSVENVYISKGYKLISSSCNQKTEHFLIFMYDSYTDEIKAKQLKAENGFPGGENIKKLTTTTTKC